MGAICQLLSFPNPRDREVLVTIEVACKQEGLSFGWERGQGSPVVGTLASTGVGLSRQRGWGHIYSPLCIRVCFFTESGKCGPAMVAWLLALNGCFYKRWNSLSSALLQDRLMSFP